MRPRVLTTAVFVALSLSAGCGGSEQAATTVGSTAPPATTSATMATTTTTTTTTLPPGGVITVPSGSAPTVDGTLDDSAWEEAAATEVDGRMTLLWLEADGVLYVGVRYDRLGAINLVVADGDRIRLLHASAALGSATHVRESGTTWSLAADFTWCCRNPASNSRREQLWEEEGWYASLGGVGVPGEFEYAVADADGAHVALSWVAPGNASILWPADLPEEQAAALTGPRPAEAAFDPQQWPRLEFDG